MRAVLSLLIVMLLNVAIAPAQDPRPQREMNLNKRDALETLQRLSPADYVRIQRILEGLSERPEPYVFQWFQTNFAAREVDYSALFLTSHPPQERLELVLNGTCYKIPRLVRVEIVSKN